MLLGFLLLVIGGEYLVRASVGLSFKLNLSKMVIGLTVVSFATSFPELLVSLNAALQGAPAIAINNVIGSNIANIFLVTFAAGLTSELKSIKVSKFDLFFHLGAHFIFTLIFILAFLSAKYGLFFIFLFTFYLFRSFKNSDSKSKD